MNSVVSCACGSSKLYKDCCEVFHKDISKVESALQLMRSRYTAFTKGMGNYLMDSHHSSTRPLSEKKAIENWANSVEWKKLEILNTTTGKKTDLKGTVEFKAYFFERNKLEFIHENSQFMRENGVWMYLGYV